jgi:hypothetical protein
MRSTVEVLLNRVAARTANPCKQPAFWRWCGNAPGSLNQEVEGSNPSCAASKIKGLR